MTAVTYTLLCDNVGCGKTFDWTQPIARFITVNRVRQKARVAGWRCVKGIDFCDECTARTEAWRLELKEQECA